MNEQLQQQLLEILKDMKTNASPAFQELISQYCNAQLWYSFINLFFVLVASILGLILYKTFIREMKINPRDDDNYGWLFASVSVWVFGCLPLGFFFSHIVKYMYPLSDILRSVL